jgi:hypothetical protein
MIKEKRMYCHEEEGIWKTISIDVMMSRCLFIRILGRERRDIYLLEAHRNVTNLAHALQRFSTPNAIRVALGLREAS